MHRYLRRPSAMPILYALINGMMHRLKYHMSAGGEADKMHRGRWKLLQLAWLDAAAGCWAMVCCEASIRRSTRAFLLPVASRPSWLSLLSNVAYMATRNSTLRKSMSHNVAHWSRSNVWAGVGPICCYGNVVMNLPWEACARLSCSLLPAQTHLGTQPHALCSAEAVHAEGNGCGQPAYKSSLLCHSQEGTSSPFALPSATLHPQYYKSVGDVCQ